MDVQLPEKIQTKPCKRGRPPKNKDEVLMKRRHQKADVKTNKVNEKQITRYESFQDTVKNVTMDVPEIRPAAPKTETAIVKPI